MNCNQISGGSVWITPFKYVALSMWIWLHVHCILHHFTNQKYSWLFHLSEQCMLHTHALRSWRVISCLSRNCYLLVNLAGYFLTMQVQQHGPPAKASIWLAGILGGQADKHCLTSGRFFLQDFTILRLKNYETLRVTHHSNDQLIVIIHYCNDHQLSIKLFHNSLVSSIHQTTATVEFCSGSLLWARYI